MTVTTPVLKKLVSSRYIFVNISCSELNKTGRQVVENTSKIAFTPSGKARFSLICSVILSGDFCKEFHSNRPRIVDTPK